METTPAAAKGGGVKIEELSTESLAEELTKRLPTIVMIAEVPNGVWFHARGSMFTLAGLLDYGADRLRNDWRGRSKGNIVRP